MPIYRHSRLDIFNRSFDLPTRTMKEGEVFSCSSGFPVQAGYIYDLRVRNGELVGHLIRDAHHTRYIMSGRQIAVPTEETTIRGPEINDNQFSTERPFHGLYTIVSVLRYEP